VTNLLYQQIDQLSKEKGINPDIVVSAVEDAVLVATRKFYKSNEDRINLQRNRSCGSLRHQESGRECHQSLRRSLNA
jgi:N utilization substance protein A